jgi:hypothetical protein
VEHQPENPQRPTHRPAPKTLGERSAAGEESCRQNAIRDSRFKVAEESHAPVKPRVLGRYLCNEGCYCHRAWKKTWLDPTTRRKRYRWCLLRKKWDVMQWRKVVYCDEKILGPAHSGKSKVVRRPRGVATAFQTRYLQATFCSGRFSVLVGAGITYAVHIPLVSFRKRTPHERKNKRDKLGVNSEQYVKEFLEPKLVPLIYSLSERPEDHPTVEDGAKIHTSRYTQRFRQAYGLTRMKWPPNSPHLNPIENVWPILTARLDANMADPLPAPTRTRSTLRCPRRNGRCLIGRRWMG